MRNLLRIGTLVTMVLVTGAYIPIAAQEKADDKALIDRGKQVLTLLNENKFDELVAQFDEKMTAAMNAGQVKAAWANLDQQAGKFKSYIDEKVTTPAEGYSAVQLGCQFELGDVNAMIVYGKDGKIAGLGFRPRPPQ
jgi:hypothetical protein